MLFEAVTATTALSKQDTPDLLVLFEETFQYLHTSSMCEHESDIIFMAIAHISKE